MPYRTFMASLAVLMVVMSVPSQADDPFMPYMDPDGIAPRQIKCRIVDRGTIYHNGSCYFQVYTGGSFTVVTGNAKYAATVGPIEGNYAQGMWTEEAYASHMHGKLHDLNRSTEDPACWENDQLSICAW